MPRLRSFHRGYACDAAAVLIAIIGDADHFPTGTRQGGNLFDGALMSAVSVLAFDCTTIGAPPADGNVCRP